MFKWVCTYVRTYTCAYIHAYVAIKNSHDSDVVKAHATVFNRTGTLLSNDAVAVWRFDLKGLPSSVTKQFCDWRRKTLEVKGLTAFYRLAMWLLNNFPARKHHHCIMFLTYNNIQWFINIKALCDGGLTCAPCMTLSFSSSNLTMVLSIFMRCSVRDQREQFMHTTQTWLMYSWANTVWVSHKCHSSYRECHRMS